MNELATGARRARRFEPYFLVILAVVALSAPCAQAEIFSLAAGNLTGATLVVDSGAGTDGRGALFSVDRADGSRTLLSDFGNASQGPLGTNPVQVALDPAGEILVLDLDAGTESRGGLFQVSPLDGNRMLVSDFGDSSQGPLGEDPGNFSVSSQGEILVADLNAGAESRGALFRVNAANGARILASDFNNADQGPGEVPFGVARGAADEIFAIVLTGGTNLGGALLKVDPATGKRTMISDFGDASQGPLGVIPFGLTMSPSGRILVVDEDAGTNLQGALFRVDPVDGNRTLVSDFGDASQGPLGEDPVNLVLAAGQVLVADFSAGVTFQGALFQIDPASGSRALASNFNDPEQGTVGEDPFGVAVIPSAEAGSLQFSAADYSANEGGGSAKIAITRSGGADGAVSVGYLTTADTATEGADYTYTSGSLTFAGGESKTFALPVVDDADDEPNETVKLTLVDPDGGATLGDPATAVLTIVDDDEIITVMCAGRAATIVGTDKGETINGTPRPDVIVALGGNDIIRGLGGNDVICSGTGDDQFHGDDGDDQLRAGPGNDRLFGNTGNDQLFGDAGNDRMDGGSNSDRCDGGLPNKGDQAIRCERILNVP